jgi:predicted GTPase
MLWARLKVCTFWLAFTKVADTYAKYGHLERILPAMGYSDKQLEELQETVNAVPCDLVLSGTPIDITRVLKVDKPLVRVQYEYQEIHDNHILADQVRKFINEKVLKK